ncbi:MAG: HlyD family efflux transporter periplasmic adaptor subunit [Crocinitomix sp.]|nr:HlyD family efflux transporter periplasmic adaptor subunit [Crocinitomix sp.]
MPTNNENISLRSDEVQEIMSHVPHWMIRSGISLMFLLIALLVFISWFIKYPDVIEGTVTVSTIEPPTRLVSKNSGELQALFFEDGVNVNEGDVLATIGNSFSKETRDYLDSTCSQIKQELERDELTIEFKDENLNFGSIYESYSTLKSGVLEYQNFRETDPILFEISTIGAQIKNYTMLRSVSKQQVKTAEKEFENAQQKFKIDEKLLAENVISKVQFYEEEQKLIQAENNLGNYKKSAVENSITITNLRRELYRLKQEHKSKQTEFVRRIELGLTNIQNALDQWRLNYQIIAPSSGKLTYLKTLNENEYIATETPLFAIISDNQGYIGYVDVPKSGYGKLEIGHKVRARIDKYPYQEFGQLNGEVTEISLLANEDMYRVQFSFTDGMKSSYGKTFEYTPEMSGTADIITNDVRLLSRIFNKFRKVFD